jgi:hypothetical protein
VQVAGLKFTNTAKKKKKNRMKSPKNPAVVGSLAFLTFILIYQKIMGLYFKRPFRNWHRVIPVVLQV